MQMPQHASRESLNFLLIEVCKLHYANSHDLLEQIGLYRGQPPLLQTLSHQEGLSHSELARQLHVKPATITQMIKRMEQAGFVQRRRDVADERVSRVYLTDLGRAIQGDLEQVQGKMEAGTFSGFSKAERELVAQFLSRMRQNLLRMAEGGGITLGDG
jgi:DNA-binding MarR family transcriptional regulator